MKKWMGLLVVAVFGFCAMNACAEDQAAVSAAKAAADAQPAPVAQAANPASPATNNAAAPAAGVKAPINFGDYRSSTLATKAWAALAQNDIESVLAYTNKCIQLYAAQASKMQSSLTDYVTGSNDEIFKLWALNDVATCYYIQGEAYRNANMKDEAKEAFNKVMKDFSFGQTWDTKGWFWKPAAAAKEKLDMMAAGVNWNFGDYSSNQLVQKAWASLAANDLEAVKAYVNKTLELYEAKAKEMQASLKEYAWESKEKTFSYWALNDVGTAEFILGEAYQNAGKKDDAAAAYKKVINDFHFAQCWDPNGWFWKPAEAAQQKLAELDNV
ncbi:MAG: tetratricopeptide repeat protein [Candidatus Omnitrophica bacterium]|nr:tetratricopeptide repeat protein [Candidatus Omnitrophota bacterium]